MHSAVGRGRLPVINQTEIRFIGMQRSGNHAIINWIARQSHGSMFFHSDVKLFRNLYESMEEFERMFKLFSLT